MNKQQLFNRLFDIITEANYNKGQKFERAIVDQLEAKGMGGVGNLSKRGADAVITLHGENIPSKKKKYKLSIKAHNAAAGQLQYQHDPKKGGWHYATKEGEGQHLVNALNALGGTHAMNEKYGNPRSAEKQGQVEHIRKHHEIGRAHV